MTDTIRPNAEEAVAARLAESERVIDRLGYGEGQLFGGELPAYPTTLPPDRRIHYSLRERMPHRENITKFAKSVGPYIVGVAKVLTERVE